MTVEKLVRTPTPLEEVAKINEIIDNLGQGGGSVLMTGGCTPDYSAVESLTLSTTNQYFEKDGFVYCGNVVDGVTNSTKVLYINNKEFKIVGSSATNNYGSVFLPVSKGDSYRVEDTSGLELKFYPRLDYDSLGNRYLGTLIKSLLPIEDSSLHLLDGAVLEYAGIYKNFIDHIANLYGDGTNVPAYFCSESDWQTSVSSYGSCGRFVYDSVNKTVRLPKVSDIIQGTSDINALGDLMEAGAPNITGQVGTSDNATTPQTGAFYSSGTIGHGNGSGGATVVQIDASRSNPIYGNSDTIQPQTIRALCYMVVATGSREEVKLNFDAKADKDLSNTGYITNCITEIPQDIKFIFNSSNSSITVKAGTKLYIPNGFEIDGTTRHFDEYIVENDTIWNSIGNGTANELIMCGVNNHEISQLSQANEYCYSGDTAPTSAPVANIFWYDTLNNIIKESNDSGSTWTTNNISLPIGIVSTVESVITGIPQVFNGFGFIGSTIYKLPAIRGLIPNGRNEDSTLKNIEVITDNVSIRTITTLNEANHTEFAICKEVAGQYDISINDFTLDEVNNYLYNSGNEVQPDRFVAGNIEIDKASPYKILSLTPKTTFHCIDYNDVHNAEAVVETYSNGNNWYRIWSDGWCEQGGETEAIESTGYTVSLLKPFQNTNYHIQITCKSPGSTEYGWGYAHTKTITNFKVAQTASGAYWYACGRIG